MAILPLLLSAQGPALMAKCLTDQVVNLVRGWPLITVRLSMSKSPIFTREAALLDRGKTRLMKSGDFLTVEAFAELAKLSTDQSRVELIEWTRVGNIFSLAHEDEKYFPIYAFDPASGYRPFSLLAAIIETLTPNELSWAMAFWFGSSNSYLGGRMPKDVMMDDPAQVLDAARSEACGALHG